MTDEPFSCPECPRTFRHTHEVIVNTYGQPIQAIVAQAPPSDGKVIRDSETGEILFEAPKDRVRLVTPIQEGDGR